jgi:deoxyadenosine/deoxycytidine kinase
MDPIIQKFYDNPKDYAFLAQIKILMTHMKNKIYLDKHSNINDINNNEKNTNKEMLIFERSPLSCIHIFGEQLLADNLIDNDQQEITDEMNHNFGWIPENIIYINTSANECYNRIKKRGRNGEEKIPLDYLKHLENRYNNLYIKKSEENLLFSSNGKKIKIWILDGNNSTEKLAEEVLNIITSN